MEEGTKKLACGCCIGAALATLLCRTEVVVYGSELEQQSSTVTVSTTEEPANISLRLIERYQTNVSPRIRAAVGDVCRYDPSCSEYAKQAVEAHGQLRGGLMAIGRLARCNPLSDGGFDPVRV